MNETQQIIAPGLSAEPVAREEECGLASDLAQLTKARLSALVVITTFVGFCMASATGTPFNWIKLFHTLFGTALVTGAAAMLNQVIEVNVDRLMERTRHRPLPAGRMTRLTAFALGIGTATVGLIYLALTTTFVATYLAAATLLIYLAFYTPMKRRTSLCVTIGAVSGAIPPVIGWTAIDGSVSLGAWVLFGILFAWQMPHFLAIAWMYRDEYSQAGFVMLPRSDRAGTWTAVQSLLYSVILTGITLVPFFAEGFGLVYLVGALLCNAMLIVCSAYFLLHRTRASARILFFASILYLPGLLCLMVFAKP